MQCMIRDEQKHTVVACGHSACSRRQAQNTRFVSSTQGSVDRPERMSPAAHETRRASCPPSASYSSALLLLSSHPSSLRAMSMQGRPARPAVRPAACSAAGLAGFTASNGTTCICLPPEMISDRRRTGVLMWGRIDRTLNDIASQFDQFQQTNSNSK